MRAEVDGEQHATVLLKVVWVLHDPALAADIAAMREAHRCLCRLDQLLRDVDWAQFGGQTADKWQRLVVDTLWKSSTGLGSAEAAMRWSRAYRDFCLQFANGDQVEQALRLDKDESAHLRLD